MAGDGDRAGKRAGVEPSGPGRGGWVPAREAARLVAAALGLTAPRVTVTGPGGQDGWTVLLRTGGRHVAVYVVMVGGTTATEHGSETVTWSTERLRDSWHLTLGSAAAGAAGVPPDLRGRVEGLLALLEETPIAGFGPSLPAAGDRQATSAVMALATLDVVAGVRFAPAGRPALISVDRQQAGVATGEAVVGAVARAVGPLTAGVADVDARWGVAGRQVTERHLFVWLDGDGPGGGGTGAATVGPELPAVDPVVPVAVDGVWVAWPGSVAGRAALWRWSSGPGWRVVAPSAGHGPQ